VEVTSQRMTLRFVLSSARLSQRYLDSKISKRWQHLVLRICRRLTMSSKQCRGKDPGHCSRIHWNVRNPPLHQIQVYKVSLSPFMCLNPVCPNQSFLNLMAIPCGILRSFPTLKHMLRASWSPGQTHRSCSTSFNTVKVRRNNLLNFAQFCLLRRAIKGLVSYYMLTMGNRG